MCLRGCVTPQTLVLFLAVSSLLFAIVAFAVACNQCTYPYNSHNCFPRRRKSSYIAPS